MPSRDPSKTSLSVRLDAELVARARAVARDCAGRPHYLTLASLVEAALRDHVERYERLLAEDEQGGDAPPRRVREDNHHLPAKRR